MRKLLISRPPAAAVLVGPMISSSSCAYYYRYCFFLLLLVTVVVSRSSSWAWKHDSPTTSAFVTTTTTTSTIPPTTRKKGSRINSHSSEVFVPSSRLLQPGGKSPPWQRRRRTSLLSPLHSTVFTVQDGNSSSKDNKDAIENKQLQQQQPKQEQQQVVITTDSPIVTPSSYLDQNLTNDERSIVNIVRTRSPSVACVSSFSIPTTRSNHKKKRNTPSSTSSKKPNQAPPVGSVSLGSGSAFAISSDGYLVTNYHVIERAYQIQQTSKRLEELQTNFTKGLKSSFPPALVPSAAVPSFLTLPRRAQVYVSLKSSSEINIPSRIVHVLPERDIAILHLNSTFMMHPENSSSNSNNLAYPPAIPNGLSTDLLVGQTVLAIGNPFGLSQTVTTGVVSSLDRTVKGVAGNDIKGCIQTDAAINPGNSGGPLLNSMGQVVGVNTMIVSTSGSNAGIGFAVPLDGIWDELMDVVEEDRDKCRTADGMKRRRGWLGLKVVTDEKLQTALFQRINVGKKKKEEEESDATRQGIETTTTTTANTTGGVFVMEVESQSPALDAGIRPLEMKEGNVEIGDRIVAVNGNRIDAPGDLKKEIQCRVVGEKVTITVENAFGERRVVYTTLVEKP